MSGPGSTLRKDLARADGARPTRCELPLTPVLANTGNNAHRHWQMLVSCTLCLSGRGGTGFRRCKSRSCISIPHAFTKIQSQSPGVCSCRAQHYLYPAVPHSTVPKKISGIPPSREQIKSGTALEVYITILFIATHYGRIYR